MRGGYRHAEMRRRHQHRGRRSLCRKTVDGMQLHHFVAERFDDPPAARAVPAAIVKVQAILIQRGMASL